MKTKPKKTMRTRKIPTTGGDEGSRPRGRAMAPLEIPDAELAGAASLEALMDIIGRRAQERGLTEERLAAILVDP